MAERSVLVRLQANIADFKSQMEQARKSTKGFGDESEKTSRQATTAFGRMAASARDHQQAWDTAGTSLAGFGAVTVAALGATVKAAMDWESAWAGVTKTLPDGADFAATEKGLRDLARTLPATHSEIAAVAEAAGQLGVAADAIVPFTKVMIDLGETTNLSADEAATAIAQMMNVMKTAPEDVGRLGAALVELGNNGASTEADIMNMVSYLTGSAALIGATESDVLALANTMTSLGINAERGGGVMTRTMQDIYAAVANGGDQLEGFAKVAGMSGAEFARAFEADPIRAIGAFTDGLAAAKSSGENVIGILSDLGIKGTQDTGVLLQMAGAQGMLNENLDTGAKAWEDNTALVEEANKRYDTTAAKLEIARNGITDAAIEIGQTFLPVLAEMAEGLAGVAGWFADLPDPIQGVLGGLGGVAGVASLAGGAFLLLFPRVIETRKAFQTLKSDMPGVATGLGKVGRAAGIAGAFIAAAAAADSFFKSIGPGPATMEETTKALLGMRGGMEGVNDVFASKTGLRNEIEGLADAAKLISDPGLTDRINDFGGSLGNIVTFGMAGSSDGSAARTRIIDDLERVGESLALVAESGDAELAAEQFDLLAAEWEKGGGNVEDLLELMPAYKASLGGVDNEQRLAAESARLQANQTVLLARDLDNAYGSIEGYAAALGLDEEATEALIKKTQELGTSLGDFINPLGAYTTMLDEKAAAEEAAAIESAEAAGKGADAWRDFVTDSGFSFDEYMRRLEEQVTAQANWQTNMLILAGRVSQGTLDELARMGPEGAPLVADLVKRSAAELDRFDEITALRSQEATDAWGAQLTLAAPVLAQVGAMAGQGVVDELAAKLMAGTTTVADIAKFFGINLAAGVNPVLTALGRPPVSPMWGGAGSRSGLGGFFAADGGVVDYYADGGVESHTAQIAPAGAWRVWAEPETGGEAYIPLAPGKRARSVDIWRETGRRLGIQDIENYANGGFWSTADVPRPPSTAPFSSPISTVADAAMMKAYDETVAWVAANAAATGPIGAGASGGSWQSIWARVTAQFPQARKTSDYRPGDPGYHGRGKAVDVAGPRPGDSATMLAINKWAAATMGGSLAELIYTPGINLYQGRPHTYGAATRADHYDHVHLAAMAKGGILNPHVRDQGGPLLPGYTFNGTGMRETVIPTPNLVDGRTVSATLAPADIDRLARAIASRERPSVSVDARGYGADQIARQIETREQRRAALASAW